MPGHRRWRPHYMGSCDRRRDEQGRHCSRRLALQCPHRTRHVRNLQRPSDLQSFMHARDLGSPAQHHRRSSPRLRGHRRRHRNHRRRHLPGTQHAHAGGDDPAPRVRRRPGRHRPRRHQQRLLFRRSRFHRRSHPQSAAFDASYTRWGPIQWMAPETLLTLGAHLERRGWSGKDIAAVLGGNFFRVAQQAWRA